MKVSSFWRVALLIAIITVCSAFAETVSSSEDKQKGLPDGGAPCSIDKDCGHGKCVNFTCKCELRWTNSSCTYEKKSQKTAFLLNLIFLGLFGAGRLYLGLVLSGIFLVLFSVIAIGCGVFTIGNMLREDFEIDCDSDEGIFEIKRNLCIALGFIVFGLAALVWSIVDTIVIGCNILADSYGVIPFPDL